MIGNQRAIAKPLLAVLSILGVAFLITVFNGGINVGQSNHTGLVPVVRRILDPNYLPNDFGISTRFYHHRVFAYVTAGTARLMGEDNALIALNVIGMLLLSLSLFYLCKSVRLTTEGFLVVGAFLALSSAWVGFGLEQNYLVGNPYIMPTTFAHAFVLLGTAALIEERYHLASFMAGMSVLFHLQIGAIFALLVAPFYLARIKQVGFKRALGYALLFSIPAAPSLWHLLQINRGGLLSSSALLDYINFRQPHHFALVSAKAALWVAAHLVVAAAVYYYLRREQPPIKRGLRVLLAMSLLTAFFSLLHFLDYYALKTGTILSIQFIRMSPLITLFGVISAVVAITRWIDRRASRTVRLRFKAAASAALILTAAAMWFFPATRARADYYPGVKRYAEQRSSWVDICLWVAEHGPGDTVYLTPPGNSGFTYLSNRSTVVEYKINPDEAHHLSEWMSRLSDLSGGRLPTAGGFRNGPLLNAAYAALEPDALISLGQKYRAGLAVLPAPVESGFEVLYKNKDYQLVRLPYAISGAE